MSEGSSSVSPPFDDRVFSKKTLSVTPHLVASPGVTVVASKEKKNKVAKIKKVVLPIMRVEPPTP